MAIALLILIDATIEERRIRRRIRRPGTGRGERPESAREVIGQIVERLSANVDPRTDRVVAPELSGQVVDELMVRLIAVDRERTRVPDDRPGYW